MHILRSSYLHLYMRHVLRPFSSDPFPSSVPAVASNAARSTASTAQEPQVVRHNETIISTQRETAILDLFILIRSRQDMRSDESDLYLDNEDERYRDMFNFMQVRHQMLCAVLCTTLHSSSHNIFEFVHNGGTCAFSTRNSRALVWRILCANMGYDTTSWPSPRLPLRPTLLPTILRRHHIQHYLHRPGTFLPFLERRHFQT